MRHEAEREFRVWAPDRGAVDLILDDGEHRRTLPMTAVPAGAGGPGAGWWSVTTAAPVGARYGFALDGEAPRPDPRALRLPDGPEELSAVIDLDAFAWTDDGWDGVPLLGSVIYELHVGTFTADGTFAAAIDRLDHLAALGVDVVELMPVAPFPGRHGWGYDGVAPWAVHEPYGGPAGLAAFVDACHERGLGVLLDVVYNHLGPAGNVLPAFGPYFTDAYRTPWGWALNLDGPHSDTVHDYVIENALHWLRDYHLDGLRLDAIHELHDERATPMLADLARRVGEFAASSGVPRWLIAESDRNDPRTVLPAAQFGLGMAAQWADDVHHGLHVALTGETQGYYGDFAAPEALPTLLGTPFFHAGTWSSFRNRTHGRPLDREEVAGWRFVVALQTHDQVGNRRLGDRLSALVGPARLGVGAVLLLTSPYTPMLFMGEEFAAGTPWQFFTDFPDPELADAVRNGRRAEFESHGWSGDDVPDPQSPRTVADSTLDWDEPYAAPGGSIGGAPVTPGGQPGAALGSQPGGAPGGSPGSQPGDPAVHTRVLAWYRALLSLRRNRADLRDPDLSRVIVHDESGVREGAVLVIERGRHRVAVNLSAEAVGLDLRLPPADKNKPAVILFSLDETCVLDAAGRVVLEPDGAVIVGPAT